jgi:tripartite-type tricarboxylate transporter receptor subunit TctC
MHRDHARLTLFVLLAATPSLSHAQPGVAYPSKPVRVIVAYPPGQAIDILARVLAQRLTDRTGQQFIVDNRPGASGIIGTEIGAKATADGYTLTMSSVGAFSGNPHLFAKLPYDPLRDFEGITRLVNVPLMLFAAPNVPADSVKELVALGARKGSNLTYATTGSGNTSHLLMELFKGTVKAGYTQVNYKGSAAAHTDMIAGRVDLMFDTVTAAAPHVLAKRLKGMAVSNARRSPALPDLPTFVEAGVAGFVHPSWIGVCAPRGVPAPVLAGLNALFVAAVRDAELKPRFEQMGMEPSGDEQSAFHAFIRAEFDKWGKVIRDAGIRLE